MGRRRRRLKEIDWGLDPERAREVIAVVLLSLGSLFFLSLFGIAGIIGEKIQGLFFGMWGSIGLFVPFIFLALGLALLMPDKFPIKKITVLGVTLIALALPALISVFIPTGGGAIGVALAGAFKAGLGTTGAAVFLFGLIVVSIIFTTSMSLKELWLRLTKGNASIVENEPEPRVSVFATVRNRMAGKNGFNPVGDVGKTKPLVMKSDPNWNFPSFDLLSISQSKAQAGNISRNVEAIQKTLKDFGIDVAMGDVHIGPTVTQYTLKPSEGIKLNQITARQQDLALALAAHPIRVEAPIPGKAAVGIEIPNKVAATVTLREVLETEEYISTKSRLALALGRDVAGLPISVDLEKMPHLLIAGATGSGKSIAINGIILTLLYRNSPADLRLILVDPKRVEFTQYNNVPHLLTPVVTEADKTVNVLKWAVSEMERRFQLFSEIDSRDIQSYNEKIGKSTGDNGANRLPFIVIIIDELADLMAQSANEVEAAIVRLSQMARATGIHLIVATQRPSVDVITGLIKANIATRVAFAVASQIDSRTIIDQGGAEKLLGRGDMLYLGTDFANKPKRIQGIFVTEKEIQAVTGFLKDQGGALYDESILEFGVRGSGMGGSRDIDDDLYEDAKQIVVQAGKASASLLQRRLRVGYARAARLLDILEAQGIIGPGDGARPRDILISLGEAGDNANFDDSRFSR